MFRGCTSVVTTGAKDALYGDVYKGGLDLSLDGSDSYHLDVQYVLPNNNDVKHAQSAPASLTYSFRSQEYGCLCLSVDRSLTTNTYLLDSKASAAKKAMIITLATTTQELVKTIKLIKAKNAAQNDGERARMLREIRDLSKAQNKNKGSTVESRDNSYQTFEDGLVRILTGHLTYLRAQLIPSVVASSSMHAPFLAQGANR